MTLLKKEKIGAIKWGLVAGKTNTIFAWDAPVPTSGEPDMWFHDIFMKNGSPYRQDEVNILRN